MRPSRALRMIALCLLLALLCNSCALMGIKVRKKAPMLINGTNVECIQLDSGDYSSGNLRSLVNYLGMQPDFEWYIIPAQTLAQGGQLYATTATDRIVNSMNYLAWDYRPNDTDVPRMQLILKGFGFTEDQRITSRWLEEHPKEAIQLADLIQKEAMGFASYSRNASACVDTSQFIPAFNGQEAYRIYPSDTLAFTVNGCPMEALAWAGTNGLYEHRSLHHALRAFDLTADCDPLNLTAGDYTVSPSEHTALLADAVQQLAWSEAYAHIEGIAALRAFLTQCGLDATTPLTADWLCHHMDQTVLLYQALPELFQRWCAGVPLFCTQEAILSHCSPS